MKNYDVVTIGAASRDMFFRSADFRVRSDRRFPTGKAACIPLGAKIDIPHVLVSTGGGATNAAATFASLGYVVAFLGKVGEDDDGKAIVRELSADGVDTQFVRHDPRDQTALSVLLSTFHHGRTVLVYRGASAHILPRDLPLAKVRTRWFYVSSLGGRLDTLQALLRHARTQRVPVLVNPGQGELQYPRRLLRLLRDVAVVMVNREEANTLVGTSYLPVPEVLRHLASHLRGMLVVTDEARGAWVRAGDDLYHSGTHRSLKVKERTGAGDAFGSGFLSGLLAAKGDPVVALQYATANAESVMQVLGAKNGILRRPPRPRERIPVSRQQFLL